MRVCLFGILQLFRSLLLMVYLLVRRQRAWLEAIATHARVRSLYYGCCALCVFNIMSLFILLLFRPLLLMVSFRFSYLGFLLRYDRYLLSCAFVILWSFALCVNMCMGYLTYAVASVALGLTDCSTQALQ